MGEGGEGRSKMISTTAHAPLLQEIFNRVGQQPTNNELAAILNKLKEIENTGSLFDKAEATLELLVRKVLGVHVEFFCLEAYRVITEKRKGDIAPLNEATIRVWIGNKLKYAAAHGVGPVNALDKALRAALIDAYPILAEVRIENYDVHILNGDGTEGSAAKVRVLIKLTDGIMTWDTAAISDNITDASWQALVDGIEYKLLREEEAAERAAVAGSCFLG